MWIILAIALIIVLWFIIKPYILKYDTILAFTGGLGSGKSFLSVKQAITLLKKQRIKVKIHNFMQLFKKKKDYWEKPVLLSSIPVQLSKNEWSLELKPEHLQLQEKLPLRCVVFIDEIGSFANQYDYNCSKPFEEFIRLFRHYTKGGYMVINDQCSSNIVKEVRTRINEVNNLCHFKKWFGIFYTCKCRVISISEEITTIEENNKQDNMCTLFGFMPMIKRYDTYCYSERYSSVPNKDKKQYEEMKKYKLMRIDKTIKKPLTTDNKPL